MKDYIAESKEVRTVKSVPELLSQVGEIDEVRKLFLKETKKKKVKRTIIFKVVVKDYGEILSVSSCIQYSLPSRITEKQKLVSGFLK